MCHGESGKLYTIDYSGTIYRLCCRSKTFVLESTLPGKYVKAARYIQYIAKSNDLVLSSFLDKRIRAVSAVDGTRIWELETELECKPVGLVCLGKQGLLLAGKLIYCGPINSYLGGPASTYFILMMKKSKFRTYPLLRKENHFYKI